MRKRSKDVDVDVVTNATHTVLKKRKTKENGELTFTNHHELTNGDLRQEESPSSSQTAVPQDYVDKVTSHHRDETETFEDLNKEFTEINRGRATAGIIEKIFLMNFMCHRSFEVLLGPNVNILHGPNGSGKSAIIAAIQVALGSKALSTERGHSLSDLILQGADFALVRLRIKNKSPAKEEALYDNRYRPELFKHAIVIQRKIFKNGASEWSLFDADNKKVQGVNARQEVEKLIRHFNIHIENPASVIPQQRWKELLQFKRGEDLYNFFLEATGLQSYERNLIESESKRKESEVAIQQKLEMLPSLQRKVELLEQERGTIQNLEQFKLDLNDLEKEYAWRLVSEVEGKMKDKKQEENEKENTLKEKEEELQQLDKEIEKMRNEVNEKEKFIQEMLTEMDVVRKQQSAIGNDLTEKQSAKESCQAEWKVLKEQVEKLTSVLNDLNDRHCRMNESESEFQQMTAMDDEISSLGRERDSLTEDYENHCKTIERKTRELENLENELENMNFAIQKLGKEVAEAEQTVAKWQRTCRANIYEHFGVDEAFKQTIDRYVAAGKFHRAPIGPIVSYIKVKHRKWARAIQECIGRNVLGKFIVADHHDRRLLRSMNGNVSVVIMNFDHGPYTLRNSDLHSYRTMINEVLVDNPIVYNTLLDLCELDANLLFDTLHECNLAAQQNLSGVRCCWSVEGKRVFMRNGGLFYRGYVSNNPFVLTEDFEQAQKDASTRLEKLKYQTQSKVSRVTEMQKTRSILREEIDRATERRKFALERRRIVESKIAEKKQEREDIEAMRDSDAIIERRAKLMADKEDKEQQILRKENFLKKLEDEIQKLVEHKEKQQTVNLSLHEKLDNIYNFTQRKTVEYDGLRKRKSELEKETQQCRSCLEVIAAQVEQLQTELETKRNEVHEKYGPPLTEWRHASLEAVERAITNLTEQIKVMNERSPDRTLVQIVQELNECKAKLEKTNKQLVHLRTVVDRISNNMINWRKLYSKMHKRVERTIQLYFALFMSHRGHKGELRIDRKQRTISIQVSVASQRKSNGTYILTEDLKSLSGGERSYTTLSFMLALGEALHVPFRIFDEFDVFMDEGNRHTAYQVIFDEAKSQRNRQFIFLTPLYLPSVICNDNDLKFIALQQPSTLNGRNFFLTY